MRWYFAFRGRTINSGDFARDDISSLVQRHVAVRRCFTLLAEAEVASAGKYQFSHYPLEDILRVEGTSVRTRDFHFVTAKVLPQVHYQVEVIKNLATLVQSEIDQFAPKKRRKKE